MQRWVHAWRTRVQRGVHEGVRDGCTRVHEGARGMGAETEADEDAGTGIEMGTQMGGGMAINTE